MLLWFLLGVLVGVVPATWYFIQLNRKLRRMSKELGIKIMPSQLDPLHRLNAVLIDYHANHQQLVQQVRNWAAIFEQAPIGYIQVDSENQLMDCNPVACQYLAIQSCQQPPRLLLEVVRSYELDALIEQARNTQSFCQKDWVFYPALELLPSPEQHATRALRGSALPLGGGQVGVFLENRQEVVQLVQQRDRWVSDVAHELKTPLTSIRLVAESLQTRLEPPHRQWIDRLLNEAIRLSTLVQEFLDLSHLEVLPARQLALKSVDLVKLVKSAWLGLEPLASTKALTLNVGGLDRVIIQADEARLHRVFINLFDNSIKYSPLAHSIDLTVSLVLAGSTATATQVQIDLVDYGSGIPEPDLPFIFERLYRADPSRARRVVPKPKADVMSAGTRAQAAPRLHQPEIMALPESMFAVQPSSGSGLGLAIVRQIVEAHLGTVTAKNHPETGGAWLQIRLPLTN